MTNLIDGRTIAERIYLELEEFFTDRDRPTRVVLLYAGNNPAIESFIRIKKRVAKRLGIELVVERFAENIDQDTITNTMDLLHRAKQADGQPMYEGMIVQLPLPDHIDTAEVLAHIPAALDIDVLNPATAEVALESGMWAPVTGAVREVIRRHHVELQHQKIAVVGNGELVGKPVVAWLQSLGLEPTVIADDVVGRADEVRAAGVVITGVGKPDLITPEMLDPRVIVIDAGTSEAAGRVQGDCSVECRTHVQLITPVPGGVGPITVAILFRNLMNAIEYKHEHQS